MKPSKLLLVVMAIVLSGSVLAVAQSNVNEEKGMKPYDSWHGGDLDSVSMTNGGVVYHIPLVCFPQRGGLELCFTVYANTKQWKSWVNPLNCNNPNDPNGCTPRWIPLPRGGPGGFGNLPLEAAYVTSNLDWLLDNECNVEQGNESNGFTPTYNWSASVTAPDGNAHQFGSGGSSFGCPTPPFRALDASGVLQPDGTHIITPNGTRFTFSGVATSLNNLAGSLTAITDANGNQITVDVNSGNYTDTMGRVRATTFSDRKFPPHSKTAPATRWRRRRMGTIRRRSRLPASRPG